MDTDAVHAHLSSVPVERIRRLTAELQGSNTVHPDEIDVAVMRLLLSEYSTAVNHLRAVARQAAATVDAAAAPLLDARRAVHRLSKVLTRGEPDAADGPQR